MAGGREVSAGWRWFTLTQLTNNYTTQYYFVSQVDWRQKTTNIRKQQGMMCHLARLNKIWYYCHYYFRIRWHIFLQEKDDRLMNQAVENNFCLKCWCFFCLAVRSNNKSFRPQQQHSSNLLHNRYHRSASCNWGCVFWRIISTKALRSNSPNNIREKFSLFTSGIKGEFRETFRGHSDENKEKKMSKDRKQRLTLNCSQKQRPFNIVVC